MKDLLEKLRALESLDGIGDIADEIGKAYDDYAAGADASVSEKDKTIADQAAEIQRLQAENYKLLTATAAAEDDDTGKEPDDPSDDDAADTIQNLYDVIEEDD